MANGTDGRNAAVAIAVTVVVATLVTLLLNALFGPDDPFDDIGRLEARLAERSAAVDALAAEVGELRTEMTDLREAVLGAREEATQARQEAVQARAEAVQVREEATARQQSLEEALTAARQPPRVTVLTPEPEVAVETAEPRVTVERAEPGVSVEMPGGEQAAGAEAPGLRPSAPAVAPAEREPAPAAEIAAIPEEREVGVGPAEPPSPLALRAGELVGATVVDSQGERIAEITDVVRSRQGDALYAVLEIGGLIEDVVGGVGGVVGGGKQVPVALNAFELGPDDEVILPGISKEDLQRMPDYEGTLFEPLPR